MKLASLAAFILATAGPTQQDVDENREIAKPQPSNVSANGPNPKSSASKPTKAGELPWWGRLFHSGSSKPKLNDKPPDLLRPIRRFAPKAADRLDKLEAVEMFQAVFAGSKMGPGTGWFHSSKSRYDWGWLAMRLDVNKDGRIDRKEFKGRSTWFDRLDRDRNGMVDAADFDWTDGSEFAQTKRKTAELFSVLDASSNGRISKNEWEAFFVKAAAGKDYLTPDDLRFGVFPPKPIDNGKSPIEQGPSPIVLMLGLVSGELGSLEEGPALGTIAPDFELAKPDGKSRVRMSVHRGGRPVVIIFGSFT